MRLDIELTDQEAIALFCIVNNIGGDPKGPRSVADKVGDALRDQLDELSIIGDTSRCLTPDSLWFRDDTWSAFEKRMDPEVADA